MQYIIYSTRLLAIVGYRGRDMNAFIILNSVKKFFRLKYNFKIDLSSTVLLVNILGLSNIFYDCPQYTSI